MGSLSGALESVLLPTVQSRLPLGRIAGAAAAPVARFRGSARYHAPAAEGWQSGRMRRSRKPLSVVRRIEGSNPSPSASVQKNRLIAALFWVVEALPATRPGPWKSTEVQRSR